MLNIVRCAGNNEYTHFILLVKACNDAHIDDVDDRDDDHSNDVYALNGATSHQQSRAVSVLLFAVLCRLSQLSAASCSD